MKKCAFAVLALLLVLHSVSSEANEKKSRKKGKSVRNEVRVARYNEINAWSGVEVVLVEGPQGRVRIESGNACRKNMNISTIGNVLHIGRNIQYASCRVKVYVPVSGVGKLQAAGASVITSDMKLSMPKLYVKLTGGSEMKGKIECDRLALDIADASEIALSGAVGYLDMSVAGASDVKCGRLIAKRVLCHVSGASEANIYVAEEIGGSLSGASELYLGGGVKDYGIRKTATSSIIRK